MRGIDVLLCCCALATSLTGSRRGFLSVAAPATALAFVEAARAADGDDADEAAAALAERLAERRKLLAASRSSTDRQREFDLSKQRARTVYNATSRAWRCPPGVPCV